jgi:hypothetical protein
VLAESEIIEHGANTAADEPLNFMRPASDRRSLARRATARGAREHRVFGREPSLPAPFAPPWYAFLDADGAEYTRLAEHREARAFGLTGSTALEAHGAQCVGGPA